MKLTGWILYAIVMLLALLLGVIIVQTAMSQSAAVTLTWTAPGDPKPDGSQSKVYKYFIGADRDSLTDQNLFDAYNHWEKYAEKLPGQPDTFTVELPEGTYFMALKSCDSVGNWSDVSNVISIVVDDVTPPEAVADLK